MKRDCNSVRSKKWINRNSLENDFCKEYVDNLCSIHFNFNIYNFGVYKEFGNSLYINYGIHNYIIYIDKNDICLKLLEKNKNSEFNYHFINSYFGDNCWYECLNWIKKRKC